MSETKKTILVNDKEVETVKTRLSYEDILRLANGAGARVNPGFTVFYVLPDGKGSSLSAGASIDVVEGMRLTADTQ